MHYGTAFLFAALGLAAAGIASAQSTSSATTSPTTDDSWRMPYQSGFWGHAGASVGQSKLQLGCPPAGSCDDKDTSYRIYAGGRFNRIFGLELGLLSYGTFDRGGGETDSYGLDIPLLLGFPIGQNSSVFAKAGAHYSSMDVGGNPALVQTGKESGWGPRYGIGAQDDIDILTIGAQYSFR